MSDTVFVSRLRLGSVKESHYGEFLCRATNSLGAGTVHRVQLLRWYYVINRWWLKCFTFSRKQRPDTPSLVSPVKVYADSVIVKWKENFDGGLPNITFKLQYRPQGAIFR